MENKINVAELLKDCPKGMELDCMIYDNVTLDRVLIGGDYPIKIETPCGEMTLSKYGQYLNNNYSKCVIFPKGKTTWKGFQRPFKDGDIVAIGSDGGTQVFIFKEYIHHDYAKCYMMLDSDGKIYFGIDDYHVARLATEEEKQKLFDAIKANGYKWNAETKTLEKLVELQFKVGDRIKHKYHISQSSIVTEIKDTHYILNGELPLPFIFQDEYEIVTNKFDITTLNPFDSKVLVREDKTGVWRPTFYGFFHQHSKRFYTTSGGTWLMCIPYNEDTKHLIGTTNDCNEFYKTWEK